MSYTDLQCQRAVTAYFLVQSVIAVAILRLYIYQVTVIMPF